MMLIMHCHAGMVPVFSVAILTMLVRLAMFAIRHILQGGRHGLMLQRHTRHRHGSADRVERQHGYQEPKQQCLEKTIHPVTKYSIQIRAHHNANSGILQKL